MTIRTGSATHVGGRSANADAVATRVVTHLGNAAIAVVDGIGSRPAVVAAARLAADAAVAVACHRGAQAGIMTAADTMPDHRGAPNAVGAVVSLIDKRIEIAHVGDCAVFAYDALTNHLRRWTVDQTAAEHVRHIVARAEPERAEELSGRLAEALAELDDYVINGLAFATASTVSVSWTPLRGQDGEVDLVLVTSDGVHKALGEQAMREVVAEHMDTATDLVDPDALAAALVERAVAAAGDEADNATCAVLLT